MSFFKVWAITQHPAVYRRHVFLGTTENERQSSRAEYYTLTHVATPHGNTASTKRSRYSNYLGQLLSDVVSRLAPSFARLQLQATPSNSVNRMITRDTSTFNFRSRSASTKSCSHTSSSTTTCPGFPRKTPYISRYTCNRQVK